jgi:hypothetical protein
LTTPSASAFDPQAFEGTAEYYVVGRPPYSAQLADTVARELSLDGTGQLLDVGCGDARSHSVTYMRVGM